MPRHDDELDENPQEADVEAFGDVTVTCPKCRSTLYDDVEICWKCGHALRGADAPAKTWLVWVAGGLVAIFLFAMLWRLM